MHDDSPEFFEAFGAAWNRYWYAPSDPLPLGLLRVLIGALAFWTVFSYTFDLTRLLGADGIVTTAVDHTLLGARDSAWTNLEAAIKTPDAYRWTFSYLDAATKPAVLWTLHLAGLVVLGLFTVGLWTRVTSILALVVLLSYIHRALILTAQFEPVLAIFLFYLCLGPSGATLSLDHWLMQRRSPPSPAAGPSYTATISLRLIQIHLSVIYGMMLLGQLTSPVWWNGEGAWWLAVDTGHALVNLTGYRQNEMFFDALTHTIVAIELLFPILVRWPVTRTLAWVLSLVLWTLVALLSGLIGFALVMAVAGLAFIPGEVLRRRLPACCNG